MLFFTICCPNYLAQAISLGDSITRHNPECNFVIGLVDVNRENGKPFTPGVPYDLVMVEDLGIEEFPEMIRKYDITELNTAVKPFYFKYLFKAYPEIAEIIYLDPDILVYSPFTVVKEDLKQHDIILTPHCTVPMPDEMLPSENDLLNAGIYNLGFIALRKTENSEQMIEWWGERLKTKASINFAKGMFTDQLWMNLVPLYYSNTRILTHPGYNMAYWNLHERKLKAAENGYTVNEQFPLVFYHFSGYNPLRESELSKYQNRYTFADLPEIHQLFNDYSAVLFKNRYNEYSGLECAYSGIREKYLSDILERKKRQTPVYKRITRKIILKVIRKLNLTLYYSYTD